MVERVVITGLGALTPVGCTAAGSWAAVLAGVSGVDRIRLFDPSSLPMQIAGEVKDFDPADHFSAKAARAMDRTSQLAVVAARQALADAGLTPADFPAEAIGLVLGSAGGGVAAMADYVRAFDRRGVRGVSPYALPNMRVDSPTGHVAIDLGLRGPTLATVASCATGTVNIGEAAEIVRRGDAEIMLAGGVEAIDSPLAFACLAALRTLSGAGGDPRRACKPFDARRDGMVLAEGAVVLVLERERHARARGAQVYAALAGYGAANDAFHLAAEDRDGDGAVRAMRRALARAGLRPEAIDYVNAHGTATRMNDAVETRALKSVFGDCAPTVAISSTKSMTGHMMAAAGAFEAMVCALACRDGVVPPTINLAVPDPDCDLDYIPCVARRRPVNLALSTSMGLGGHNACLILRRHDPDGEAA